MDKKNNAAASAAAGSSKSCRIADSEAIKNLKTLMKLIDEGEELRKENEKLRQQLAAATERIESAAANLKALKRRLLAVIREKDEKKMELVELKERLRAKEMAESQRGRLWKKWIYPIAATATFMAVSAALALCCKGSRMKD